MSGPVDPLSLEIPEEITTDRLILRAQRPNDAAMVNQAICESAEALQRWMPWATPVPSLADTSQYCRRAAAKFIMREQLGYSILHKTSGLFVGSISLQSIEWKVPRFEIGYWLHTSMCGKGYMTEAVRALSAFAIYKLGAVRVEIKIDDANEKSWRVAERAGFGLEGIHPNIARKEDGSLRNERVYAVVPLLGK